MGDDDLDAAGGVLVAALIGSLVWVALFVLMYNL